MDGPYNVKFCEIITLTASLREIYHSFLLPYLFHYYK